MSTSTNTIINEVRVEATSVGVKALTTDLDRLADAEGRVATAESQAVVVSDKLTKARISAAPAVERLQRQLDKEFRAMRELEQAQKTLDRARSQGLIGIADHNRLTGLAIQKHDQMSAAVRRVANDNDRAGASFSAMATGLRSNLAALVGILAAVGGGALIQGIAKAGLEMESLKRGFAAAAGSAEQGARELTFVRDASDRLGLALGSTSQQYLGFLAASRGTALQGQATRDIFIAVSSAMGALGKNGEETSRALIAVQQMMSKGKVSAEEMTGQLGEALPGALGLSAKAMGMTQAALLKLMGDGKLLASDLLPKLAKELQATYGDAAAKAANGLQANLNRMSTAWLDYRDTIAKNGLNDALSRAAGGLAAFLNDNEAAAASLGKIMGAAVDRLREFGAAALEAYDSAKVILTMLGEFDQATTRPTVDTSGIEGSLASVTAGMADAARNDINTVIGVFVGGYQMAVAAWNGLPGAFGSLGAAAANLLISAVEGAVNTVIGGVNKVVDAINSVGANVPGFGGLEKAAAVTFGRIEAASTGTAGKLASDLATIGKDAMARDYLGEAGTAITTRFNELKAASKAAREEQKRAADEARSAGLADALKNTGEGAKKAAEDLDKAGKAAKEAAKDFESLKSTAESAAKILFPAEMLQKQGEELQAQLTKYRDQLQKIDPRYVQAVEAKIKLNLEGKELEAAKDKTDDLAKEMSRTFSGVFDDMFTNAGKGLDGLIGSISKGFSKIGTRLIEQRLISPLFEAEGKAGGLSIPSALLQGPTLSGRTLDAEKIEKAVSTGAFDGISSKFDDLLKPKAGGGFASSPLGGGLISAGAGAAIGYQSQSPIAGALGGGLAGFTTANDEPREIAA